MIHFKKSARAHTHTNTQPPEHVWHILEAHAWQAEAGGSQVHLDNVKLKIILWSQTALGLILTPTPNPSSWRNLDKSLFLYSYILWR